MTDMIALTGFRPMDRGNAETFIDEGDARFLQSYIRTLTRAQRALMALHGDGPVQIIAGEEGTRRTRGELIAKNLLRTDRLDHPRLSYPTRQGRRVIGAVLAQQAEVLDAMQIR